MDDENHPPVPSPPRWVDGQLVVGGMRARSGPDVQPAYNPDKPLRRILDRYPSGFWEFSPTMLTLRDEARAALAEQPLNLKKCEDLFRRISLHRVGKSD